MVGLFVRDGASYRRCGISRAELEDVRKISSGELGRVLARPGGLGLQALRSRKRRNPIPSALATCSSLASALSAVQTLVMEAIQRIGVKRIHAPSTGCEHGWLEAWLPFIKVDFSFSKHRDQQDRLQQGPSVPGCWKSVCFYLTEKH
ncbi:hypothetical protein N657DRAFT_440181 [Parathielavia appendiculata]|uniref:Uncharacterized protein n=1 Tax=Parathielavia appendiculata TaxID=2587402 RepID=A0AAN6Z3M1_9PEZI|nr:hypothetical protein N657DRAFT_440181 [Parathielavia appendiculata]